MKRKTRPKDPPRTGKTNTSQIIEFRYLIYINISNQANQLPFSFISSAIEPREASAFSVS